MIVDIKNSKLQYLICLTLLLGSIRQEAQTIASSMFTTESLDVVDQLVEVYLPKGYDKESSKQYRWMIYLHGASPSRSSRVMQEIFPGATEFFSNISNPLVIVVPNLIANKSPSYYNLHMYADSEYYGNYERVITHDLLAWAMQEEEIGLANKLSFEAQHMGIAGFSMGADGALQIGLRNPEMFAVIAGNSPFPSLAESTGIFYQNLVKEEACSGGSCDFSPDNGDFSKYFTTTLWGVSAAFSDGDQIEYLLDASGNTRYDILDGWRKKYDPITLIRENNLYQAESSAPFIYINMGTAENTLFSAERFQEDIENYEPAQGKYRFEFDDNGTHMLTSTRISNLLRRTYGKFAAIETVSSRDDTELPSVRLSPNPCSADGMLHMQVTGSREKISQITFYDMGGNQISRHKVSATINGQSGFEIKVPDSMGLHFCEFLFGNSRIVKRILVN